MIRLLLAGTALATLHGRRPRNGGRPGGQGADLHQGADDDRSSAGPASISAAMPAAIGARKT